MCYVLVFDRAKNQPFPVCLIIQIADKTLNDTKSWPLSRGHATKQIQYKLL